MATNSQPQESPEYRTFREHYDRLVTVILDPLPLAARLFARSIIDFTLLQRMNTLGFTTFQNINTLLSAVLGKIQTDPSAFGVFLLSLKADSSTQSLVESMERRLLSTTSGAHGGGWSVESRDGGEELSTPAVKRRCVPVQGQPSYQLTQPLVYESCIWSPVYRSPHNPSVLSPLRYITLLDAYADFLKSCYIKQEYTTKWPHLDARNYINLAVISNTCKYENREDLVKFRQQTIHGSIDDILEWKGPIRMKNILKPNCVYDIRDYEKHEHYPVTQLLVEGAPGIGKSTFAWEVCQKWDQYKLFNEYSLVVLLKFRDKSVQNAKSVSDLFYIPTPSCSLNLLITLL